MNLTLFLLILYLVGWLASYIIWIIFVDERDRIDLFIFLSIWFIVIPLTGLYLLADYLADKVLERKKKS